jgi:hypothetical protein
VRHDRIPPHCAIELRLGRTEAGKNSTGSTNMSSGNTASDASSH